MWLRKRVKMLELAHDCGSGVRDELAARIETLEKRLAELEPELEQYKLAIEEAERQERLRNDGMAAIFGYEPVTMRGGGDGNE